MLQYALINRCLAELRLNLNILLGILVLSFTKVLLYQVKKTLKSDLHMDLGYGTNQAFNYTAALQFL